MKHYAQTIDLKDDPALIAAYDGHHRAVWPEVQRGLRDIGIVQMRIWRLGRRLFLLMETLDDFDAARDWPRYMATGGRVAEWQSLMESLQQPVPDAQPGEWWAAMTLVFALSDDA